VSRSINSARLSSPRVRCGWLTLTGSVTVFQLKNFPAEKRHYAPEE
jgi:hypothetical protein